MPSKAPIGIECLCQVKPPRGCLFGPHRKDVGVATCLQERQPASEYEIGYEKRVIVSRHFGREKEKGSQRIQAQPQHDPCLVGIATNEHGRRKSHGKISPVESDLYERTLRHTHAEYLGKGFHQRGSHIVGKAPQGKTTGNKRKRDDGRPSAVTHYRNFPTIFHIFVFLILDWCLNSFIKVKHSLHRLPLFRRRRTGGGLLEHRHIIFPFLLAR